MTPQEWAARVAADAFDPGYYFGWDVTDVDAVFVVYLLFQGNLYMRY